MFRSHLRWLAVLPSAAGVAVCLSMISAPVSFVQDAYGLPDSAAKTSATVQIDARDQYVAQQAVQQSTETRQAEAVIVRKVMARRAAQREARQDARQAKRRAARAAARAAARQAAQQQAAAQQAPQQPVSTGGSWGAPPGSFEACVISRESGGNPAAVNPSSGAGGLFQFLPSTWAGLGLGYPGGAQTAPPGVQIQGFFKLYAEAGPGPWSSDGC